MATRNYDYDECNAFHYVELSDEEVAVLETAIEYYNEDISLIERIDADECYLTDNQIAELKSALHYYLAILDEAGKGTRVHRRLLKNIAEQIENIAC